jgi:hypothetical protein
MKFTRPESDVMRLDERAQTLRDRQSRALKFAAPWEGTPGAGAAPPVGAPLDDAEALAGVKVPPHAPPGQQPSKACPDCGTAMDDQPDDGGAPLFACPNCGGQYRLLPDDSDDDSSDDATLPDSDGDDDYGNDNDSLEAAGVTHPNIASRRAAISGDDVTDSLGFEGDEAIGDADALDDVEAEALADQFPRVTCPNCEGVYQLREFALPRTCPNPDCRAIWSTRDVRWTEPALNSMSAHERYLRRSDGKPVL